MSLVEVMVACALALVVILTVTRIYISSKSSESAGFAASELTSNGRYALKVLRREIMHAGFAGLARVPFSASSTPLPSITGECGAGFVANVDQAIWAANDTNPFAASCIPANEWLRGDVLVVRHGGMEPVTRLEPDRLYQRTAFERAEIFAGAEGAPLAVDMEERLQQPWLDHPLEQKIFYVTKFTESAAEVPQVPSLHVVRLRSGPEMVSELVAGNVEDFQVQFGVRGTDFNTQVKEPDEIDPTSSPTMTGTGAWDEVSSVKLWLLVRATRPEPGYRNTERYVLGSRVIDKAAAPDRFRRQVFSTVIQLRNR